MTVQDADLRSYRFIARRVVWSQMLWMAGYSLTTGPFLSYFGQDLGAKGRGTALLLIVPELAGVLGLCTRGVIRRFRGRKRVWVTFALLARAFSLGIPLAALPALRRAGFDPLWLMVASLAVSHATQAISYVAYLAWLADAVASSRWGQFFAARNVGELCIRLVVPMSAGFLRDWWKAHVASEQLLWAYVVAFGAGTVLLLLSMAPLLAVAERAASPAELRVGSFRRLRDTFENPSLCWLLIHSWWLALSTGLTQAAFSTYLKNSLHLELGTTYVLYDVMYALSIPVSWATGRIADRRGNKRLLIAGVLVAGCSLFFWLRATPDQWWWLFGAYACFGAFPAVNITGRNLVFKLAPAHDNAAPMALFQQIGGLLAGLSGLIGGIWLDRLNAGGGSSLALGPWSLGSHQVIFLTSLVGRLTAALWLLPIQERRPGEEAPAAIAGARDPGSAVRDAPACGADTSD